MPLDMTISRCPHCGSRNIDIDETYSRSVIVAYCEECDAVIEMINRQDRRRQLITAPVTLYKGRHRLNASEAE